MISSRNFLNDKNVMNRDEVLDQSMFVIENNLTHDLMLHQVRSIDLYSIIKGIIQFIWTSRFRLTTIYIIKSIKSIR